MQYIPCNSAPLAQETLFLTPKALFLTKDFQKVLKSRQILILRQNSVCQGLEFSSVSKLCGEVPSHNLCHPEHKYSEFVQLYMECHCQVYSRVNSYIPWILDTISGNTGDSIISSASLIVFFLFHTVAQPGCMRTFLE